MPKSEHRTVWSSNQGDIRKQESGARRIISLPPNKQTACLHRDSKGRGGKTVTLVKKLILSEDDFRQLVTHLKQICGSGGMIKEDMIEIQGEHREKIAEALTKLGYKVKIAGG